MTDATLVEVLERIRNRYYGKYRGTVTQVEEGTMRIKAKVPAVLGAVETGWCTACVPFAGDQLGFAFLPETGSGVWIEFEGGDVSYPIWSGCFWHSEEVPSDATASVKALVTVSGHKILFDDQAPSMTVSDPSGNSVTLDSSGITLKRGSQQIVVSDGSVSVNLGALEVV